MRKKKILYGVPGEGMGHATRSKVIITWLIAQGHEVQIVASSRAYTFLAQSFPGMVTEIEGLHLSYQNAVISVFGSFWINFKRIHQLFGSNLLKFLTLSRSYHPDLVITDFESFSHLFGWVHQIPMICIDNIQVNNRCLLDIDIPASETFNQWLATEITASKVPAADKFLISSFFETAIIKSNTSLVPPIIREVIQQTNANEGNHVLMYQTSAAVDSVEAILSQFPTQSFIVYGLNRDELKQNIRFKPFSETEFIADLASAKAVIANGGFSFISEAVYLHKPIYSFPIQGQFEQYINAAYIDKLGYGLHAKNLNATELTFFFNNLKRYQANLANYQQDGNQVLFELLSNLP